MCSDHRSWKHCCLLGDQRRLLWSYRDCTARWVLCALLPCSVRSHSFKPCLNSRLTTLFFSLCTHITRLWLLIHSPCWPAFSRLTMWPVRQVSLEIVRFHKGATVLVVTAIGYDYSNTLLFAFIHKAKPLNRCCQSSRFQERYHASFILESSWLTTIYLGRVYLGQCSIIFILGVWNILTWWQNKPWTTVSTFFVLVRICRHDDAAALN